MCLLELCVYSFLCSCSTVCTVTVYTHTAHTHILALTHGWRAAAKGVEVKVVLSSYCCQLTLPDPHAIGPPSHGRAMARICAIQLAAQFAALCDGATTELDYLACTATEMVSPGNTYDG